MKKLLALAFALCASLALQAQSLPPLNVVIVGDSTVCNYPETHSNRGWGMYIGEYFKPGTVNIINLAASGRSTKTFISEGRWEKALDAQPSYVLIQFGHNDSHSREKPEATDAATDYRENLRRYIDDTRVHGATPILVTPMVRRTFDAEGKLDDNLTPYADAMKAVAREKHVGVIDLHSTSQTLVEKLGPEHAQDLASKPEDHTHFNEKGARAMAELVAKGLPHADAYLGGLLKESSENP